MTPLAEHITAILSDPETPPELYNEIRDALLSLADSTGVSINSPEMLPHSLPQIIAKLKARETAAPVQEWDAGIAARHDAEPPYKEHEDEEIFPPLSYTRALEFTRELVIVYDFNDTQIYLFTELIGGIAYNYDRVARDGVAVGVINEAYTHSNHCGRSADAFLQKWREEFKPHLPTVERREEKDHSG